MSVLGVYIFMYKKTPPIGGVFCTNHFIIRLEISEVIYNLKQCPLSFNKYILIIK